MILIVCLPCSFAIRVMPANVGAPRSVQELDQLVGPHSDFWPDKYECPRCGGKAMGVPERGADPRVVQQLYVQDATPQETFAALKGLGFPDEQKCTLEVLEALLREQPVRRIHGTNITGMERTLVDAFELWDGTKVYFGSGAEGAVIYRVVRPISYTKQQLAETSA